MELLPLLLDAAGGEEAFVSLFDSDGAGDDLELLSDDPLPLESEFLEEGLDEA